MVKTSRSINHACHNKTLCHKLFSDGEEWHDWVVTTAFYSALHYIEHAIFPLKDNLGGKEKTFLDFNRYRHAKKPANMPTHDFRYSLVQSKIPSIAGHYKRLMDQCSTARYIDYNIPSALTQRAVDDLKAISECCEKTE